MNVLAPAKAKHLYRLFSYGHGERESARLAGVNRKTASNYRKQWLHYRSELQRAYDAMWAAQSDECDEITANLPDQMVIAMFEAWQDDQSGEMPRSGWHAGLEETTAAQPLNIHKREGD